MFLRMRGDLFPTPREQRWARKSNSDRSRSRRTPHPPHGLAVKYLGIGTNITNCILWGRGTLREGLDEFMVVRSPSPYNGVIGRPGLKKEQPRRVHLETSRHERRPKIHYGAPFECPGRVIAHKAKKKRTGTRPEQSHPRRNANKGYHQIQMAEEDEDKTSFHTNQGLYIDAFGLKNAGATSQRRVDKAFEKQIGRNLEVYVDELVIKSHTEQEILRDIEETF
ncbi:hypothetical protein Tco_1079952 [Tanacetum coccineum]|uniref:Reverse transcriptase domain-containing protein n=1 Tax=Tanacetum coccineum TaxID=301880 RepID=A0ABQ5HV03_9ASTR